MTEAGNVEVNVVVPSLLAHCTGGERTVTIDASHLRQCWDSLLEKYPLLKNHLHEETGDLREHVNVFCNGESVRWMDDWTSPFEQDSTVIIVQAVSGG